MKFNYVKVAKQRGCSNGNFDECFSMKYIEGKCEYMAAHWLAWYYEFKRHNEQDYAIRNLRNFLKEIANICSNKEQLKGFFEQFSQQKSCIPK